MPPGPVHHTIVAMDVAGSGRLDDPWQLRMRADLRAIVAQALARQPLDPQAVHHTDLGDGVRLIVEPSVSPQNMLDPFVHNLAAALRAHRRLASPAMRLRLAVHMGLLHHDGGGWAGEPLVHCARLLDAAPVRQALTAVNRADLVVVVSQPVYDAVVRYGYGLDPDACRRIAITEKETVASAWIHIPGHSVTPDGSIAATAWRALRDHAYGKLTNGMLINLAVAATTLLVLVMVVDNAGGRPNGPGGPDTHVTERQPQPARSSTSLPERPPTVSPGTSVRLPIGSRDGTVVRIACTDWVAVTGSGRQYGQRKWGMWDRCVLGSSGTG